MLQNHHPVTIYKNRTEAEALAARLSKDDREWTYKVSAQFSGGYVIAVYDEDNHPLGYL